MVPGFPKPRGESELSSKAVTACDLQRDLDAEDVPSIVSGSNDED
jgi:hypothetical protein